MRQCKRALPTNAHETHRCRRITTGVCAHLSLNSRVYSARARHETFFIHSRSDVRLDIDSHGHCSLRVVRHRIDIQSNMRERLLVQPAARAGLQGAMKGHLSRTSQCHHAQFVEGNLLMPLTREILRRREQMDILRIGAVERNVGLLDNVADSLIVSRQITVRIVVNSRIEQEQKLRAILQHRPIVEGVDLSLVHPLKRIADGDHDDADGTAHLIVRVHVQTSRVELNFRQGQCSVARVVETRWHGDIQLVFERIPIHALVDVLLEDVLTFTDGVRFLREQLNIETVAQM